ncbi:hypothetical protein SKAU_G00315710 [Synaphobranchus kaupii]|uniref:VWFD domain-containing protein n=1 Tax=Synaphobranchus kaupii TaxID=118154 RepID=A0A9Q1ESN2_SYNKA|nr:hypothetical protein SKAU_G00315710 [Synaphobranchus kaupii]
MWNCTDQKCPGTCTIYGSGHHMTFDEKRFGFRGQCGYVAVQVEEVSHEGSPFIDYTVRIVGLYIVVDSRIGISVVWDRKTSVRIILEPDLMGKVCGLCGDFDGDAKDDFTTQGQLVVSSPLEFANSWKVSSSCPDAGVDTDPCSSNPHRHSWAMLQCSIIKGNTFKNCHDKVDPIPYYDNCVSDSCACDTGGDCECFCTAVAAYAQACNEAEVCVAWRTPDLCPVYCDYFNAPLECKWHYSPCHTPCYKTCFIPQGICNNPQPNMEGCYPSCPPEKPIFDEGKQICVEVCDGCYINGTEYRPGQEVPTEELCTSCTEPPVGTGGTVTPFSPLTGPQVSLTTTPCFCIVNGTQYQPGATIYNMTHIGSGICLTIICSSICEIHNTTYPCPTSPTPPTPKPPIPECPEWDVVQNETFLLCNCTMAICIENNTIEIIPFKCPPLEIITCTNRKKPVLEWDENGCCQHYVCDCYCEGWGDPHYITFDGLFYSFQGNCTYVLMEEITAWHKLKIYIDNVHCDPAEVVSCPRSIIVSYKTDVITLKNHNLIGAANLEVSRSAGFDCPV